MSTPDVAERKSAVYADGRTFELPAGWEPIRAEVLGTALEATTRALATPDACERLKNYYDPDGDYSGLLFAEVEPNDPHSIGATDLWAVSTLSIPVHSRQGRLLLDPGNSRTQVIRQLNAIDDTIPIVALEHAPPGSAALLTKMWDLHDTLRSLLATDERASTHWVFAAKMCARKRPRLFPVRDTLVSEYLADGRPLKTGDGWPGDFSVDIQTYAYLLTHPQVVNDVARLRRACEDTTLKIRVDNQPLRFLDAALWTYAKWRTP